MLVFNANKRPSSYSGRLITFEGGDGTGKTTALTACYQRAKEAGYDCMWSEWDDSQLTGKALHAGKEKHLLTPLTFTLLTAANIADRLVNLILPVLNRGGIVFTDRWMYTSFARDAVRGNDRQWMREVYQFCPQADLSVFFDCDPEVALERKKNFDQEGIKFYEAGEDFIEAETREQAFLRFQALVRQEYQRMVPEFGMVRLDADQSMERVEEDAWRLVNQVIADMRKAA